MKRRSIMILRGLVLSVIVLALTGGTLWSEDYDALTNLTSVKALFDFRIGNPESAAMHLDLILQTFKDENIAGVTDKPDFALVFIGPSVKLISTQTEGFSEEEIESLTKIANTIKEMAKAGIKLEVCLVAVHVMGVDPATILPEITQVGNGYITVIGYQAKGYSLVPVY